MKYAIIGIGAIGTVVGAILRKSGNDVLLIVKENQIETISKKGLKVTGLKKSINVNDIKTTSDLSSLKDTDVIIVCVKSQDTKKLANDIKKYINKSSLFISLQNGTRNSEILEEETGHNAISGVVMLNALNLNTGEARITIKGGVLLGYKNKYETEIKIIIDSFKKFGLTSYSKRDIKSYQYSKLIVNLQNAVTALTGQTVKESIIDSNSRRILTETMKEGMDVLEKSKIPIKTLPEMDPIKIIKRLSFFNSIFLKLGSRLMKIDNAKTSMLQSILRGKPTEIDYINGEIVRIAKENNLKAPINNKLVELVKEIEKKDKKIKYNPYELRKILKL